MEIIDDSIQPSDELWGPPPGHRLKSFSPWVDGLIRKKHKEGRYYFHPDPTLSVFTKSPRTLEFDQCVDVRNNLKPYFPAYTIAFRPGKMFPASTQATTVAVESHAGNVQRLEQKIRFLEAQLESQRPYVQLYRLGATSLFVALISLAAWALTGTGIPFHPLFAAGAIPAAIGVIIMAFLIRPGSERSK